jgi:hypothetical protein
MTRRCEVGRVAAKVFRIVLTQGLNRQIRKMCEALGYEVVALQRTRIMHIELGHLKVGRWRNLTEAEVAGLTPDEPRAAVPAPAPRVAPAAPRPESPRPAAARPSAPTAKPKPKPIPFGQPGGVGGPPLDRRGGRGGPRRGR